MLGPAPRAKRSLGEVARLATAGESIKAVVLASKIRPYLAGDPEFRRLWTDIARLVNVDSEPPGAKIYYKAYSAPESEWHLVGRTPVQNLAIPAGWGFLIKAEKEGFETAFGGSYKRGTPDKPGVFHFSLDPRGSSPPGMLAVPAPANSGAVTLIGLPPLGSLRGGFYVDRDEVTNGAFKKFVDSGGYQNEQFWKQPFVKNGRALSWTEAMQEFKDRSGRPGPATWEAGSFFEGRADEPVGGVRACSHYPQRFDDKREAKKGQEHDVEFFKTRKDAAEAFEAPEQPLNLVALRVQGTIIFPRMQPVGLRRNYRNHA